MNFPNIVGPEYLANLLQKKLSTIKVDSRRKPETLPPRLQLPGSTKLLWVEEDEIHPDYDTPALRDVARLYVKYDQLFKEKEARRAHQVAVPMTEAQIFECDQSRTSCLTSSGLILPALSKPITA